jgi:hypothetical protein
MWSGYETPFCKVHAGQLGGDLSHFALKIAAFAEFSARNCVIDHTKSKLLRLSERKKVNRLQSCNEFLDFVKG